MKLQRERFLTNHISELDGKNFAYDGEKSLFTIGTLPSNKLEFTFVLEDVTSNRNNGNASPDGHDCPNKHDTKRLRWSCQSKTFKHAAKQGCLRIHQSYFQNDPKNFIDIRDGVLGCRGYHSSLTATQTCLSLNIDVSTTMIIQPGVAVDFTFQSKCWNSKQARLEQGSTSA
ncbi:hypothetical protein REPUB_Repub07fG0088300 [Reevesia pubescens]